MRGVGAMRSVRAARRPRGHGHAREGEEVPKSKTSSAPKLLEQLETRSMLSASYPTAFEQYVIELINRARANPSAEAKRYGIDLNEGLAGGTISSGARQPLAINP